MSTSRGYHEYIRGCSVHRGNTIGTSVDIMITSGGVQYIGRIPRIHQGDIISTSGDIQYIGRYEDACGGAR